MDALTNVVAVLILVLVLVQADVSQKVQQFFDDLPPATPEDIAQTKTLLDDLDRKQRISEARLREKPPTPEDIEEEKRQIALLEKSMEEKKELLANREQVRALEKKVRAERDAENTETSAIQKEIARMEALLDTTPPMEESKPTVVNIPNSRAIPDDATMYYAIVNQGRVHMLDPQTPIAIIHRELEQNKREWLHNHVKIKGKPDRFVFDGTKITNHFRNFKWGNTRGQKIEIRPEPTGYFLWLVIRPDHAQGGTPLQDLGQPGNEFAKAVATIRQNFKSVLLYRVHPNSFDTYLAARNLTEKVNIAAGWDINSSTEFHMPIPDLTVKRLMEPPAPKPGSPPKPPRPPALKPKLD
jgi:hypothetical protein